MSLKIQCDVHRHSFEHRWTDHSKLLKSLFARGEDDKGKTSSSLCRLSVPSGGADRDRTGDPLLAKQVLSQLSYSPVFACLFSAWLRCSDSLAQSRTQVRSFTRSPPRLARRNILRKTSCLPIFRLAALQRLTLQLARRSDPSNRRPKRNRDARWWVWEDLNFRPHPYQGCALTN